MHTPKRSAQISIIDCQALVETKSSGITETAAI